MNLKHLNRFLNWLTIAKDHAPVRHDTPSDFYNESGEGLATVRKVNLRYGDPDNAPTNDPVVEAMLQAEREGKGEEVSQRILDTAKSENE